MLPKRMREGLFEKASVKTMRYVDAIPIKESTGLNRRVFEMIADDFFVNGSLSSHSQIPELFAGTWLGGREIVLVTDKVDRTTKEAMGATISYINECPYCADMLVSLVHGSGKHDAATSILNGVEETVDDPQLRARLSWVREITTAEPNAIVKTPFTADQLPEALGALFVLNYVNRFSHVVMDGSPVGNQFKNTSLKLFGYELRETTERPIQPGRALDLLPPVTSRSDIDWTRTNPRIADTIARWSAAVEHEARKAISTEVMQIVQDRLNAWNGEQMPISRNWVERDIAHLQIDDYHTAKLILIVAMASYQVDDAIVQAVLGEKQDQKKLIRVLSYASLSAALRLANIYSKQIDVQSHPENFEMFGSFQ